MNPIIYDVAVSIDGYISGPDGDISQFAHDGPIVEDYKSRLQGYAVAIMGRGTYEFGYRFGMEPGQNPYPHMTTVVFSRSLRLPVDSAVTVRSTVDEAYFHELKNVSTGPIYLCGGGVFATSLLELDLVDQLRLKRAPVILGDGASLFAPGTASPRLRNTKTKPFEGGYVYQEFERIA